MSGGSRILAIPVEAVVRFEGKARVSDELLAHAKDPDALTEQATRELFRSLANALYEKWRQHVVNEGVAQGYSARQLTLNFYVLDPQYTELAFGASLANGRDAGEVVSHG